MRAGSESHAAFPPLQVNVLELAVITVLVALSYIEKPVLQVRVAVPRYAVSKMLELAVMVAAGQSQTGMAIFENKRIQHMFIKKLVNQPGSHVMVVGSTLQAAAGMQVKVKVLAATTLAATVSYIEKPKLHVKVEVME